MPRTPRGHATARNSCISALRSAAARDGHGAGSSSCSGWKIKRARDLVDAISVFFSIS